MNKLAAALSVLTIASASEGCESQPKVKDGIELVNPELNRQLTCTRELFGAVGIHNPLDNNDWAEKNCPGFNDEVERLLLERDPLAKIVELRDQIFAKAGVASGIESWIRKAVEEEGGGVEVRVNPLAVQEARRQKRVR